MLEIKKFSLDYIFNSVFKIRRSPVLYMETEFFAGVEERVQCVPVQCVYKTVLSTLHFPLFLF